MSIKINRKLVEVALAMKGMTARDLARASNIAEPTIYNVMAGKPFTSETLGKIASALDLDPGDLISTSEVEIKLTE